MNKLLKGAIAMMVVILVLGISWGKYDIERRVSISHERHSGDFCPMCKSKDLSRFIYGLKAFNDSAILENERKQKLIRGGCVLSSKSPKYKCNSCSYEWGTVFRSKK